ncbi:hypothetical protein GCK72_019517 [Caenorhabditis remanei]|uniref:NADAR domain-containing protein n=1 Tax=Caenorhabditis remanei TaxID=31234 RepID=A0A6A5GEP6_CAERE|nr:hypothetical protein GCK72_019517 [Caenorhabditis remanei]KAF1752962.1 hypothetical protein GCK72_019517 [Caenorhabditis remanei]
MLIRVFISKNQYRKFVLFYKSECVFSNFYPVEFTASPIQENNSRIEKVLTFNCSEQYFMYHKALLVGDEGIAEKIMNETDPKKMKVWGRRLEMSEQHLQQWSKMSREIMYCACLAKFSKDASCRKTMFRTHGMKLVEASPGDRIWGIGLDKNDKRCEDERTWRGTNWLGEILDRVRDELWERKEFKNERELIQKESLETRCQLLEQFASGAA